MKKEKSPKLPKQKALKKASETASTSDDAASAATTSNASPSRASGAKNVTPRVVLKASKSPKGLKAKGTPGRKPNADGTPPKPRGKHLKL